MVGNTMVKIPKGSILTGRKSLAKTTKINEYKIERLLKLFESCNQIAQQTFTRYRLISITNWDKYQESAHQTHNDCTTTAQQPHTNNNVNKDNNVNKKHIAEKKGKNNVPYTQITDLYHHHLPNNPSIASLSATRKSHIKARWKNDLLSIDSWEKYFKHIAKSEFLTGRAYTPPGKKPFFANIDWVINENNMLKIIEGNYHGG